MKIKSLFYALFFGLIIVTFFLFSIMLNNYLALPILSNPFLVFLGLIQFLIGLSVHLASIYFFKRIGKGTPVPIEPPKKLVYAGLFKYVRNPMYLAIFADILGGFFIFGHLLLFVYAIVFFTFIHLFVVFVEEPKLKERFGKEYEEYTKSVPRWIPKIAL